AAEKPAPTNGIKRRSAASVTRSSCMCIKHEITSLFWIQISHSEMADGFQVTSPNLNALELTSRISNRVILTAGVSGGGAWRTYAPRSEVVGVRVSRVGGRAGQVGRAGAGVAPARENP